MCEWVCVFGCVWVCVCVSERERGRESNGVIFVDESILCKVYYTKWVCVFVSDGERERERGERDRERERERGRQK